MVPASAPAAEPPQPWDFIHAVANAISLGRVRSWKFVRRSWRSFAAVANFVELAARDPSKSIRAAQLAVLAFVIFLLIIVGVCLLARCKKKHWAACKESCTQLPCSGICCGCCSKADEGFSPRKSGSGEPGSSGKQQAGDAPAVD